MEARLNPLLLRYGCPSYRDLYWMASGDRPQSVRRDLIDAITTNETLWFRDTESFEVLESNLLPRLGDAVRQGKPKARIWCAACSTGQEPYSIAMVLHDFLANQPDCALEPRHFEIVATDISLEALATAASGVYGRFSLDRGLPAHYLERYFEQSGAVWEVLPHIRKIVGFRAFDPLDPFAALGTFDIVFCRNVAIYFSDETKVELLTKIRRKLNPQGIPILGSTESLPDDVRGFAPNRHERVVFYQAAAA